MDPRADMDATTICAVHREGEVWVDLAFAAEPKVQTTVNLVALLGVGKLDEDLARQAGLASWWGTLLTRAQAALDVAELEQDRVEARLYEAHRARCVDEHVPATNMDKVISARRTVDDGYCRARLRVVKLREAVRVLERIVKGFDARERMLSALAANLRQDWSRERILSATGV